MAYNSGFKYFMHFNKHFIANKSFNLIEYSHLGNPLTNSKFITKDKNIKLRLRYKQKFLKKYNSLIVRNKFDFNHFKDYPNYIKNTYSKLFLTKFTKFTKPFSKKDFKPVLLKMIEVEKKKFYENRIKNNKRYKSFYYFHYNLYKKFLVK